MLSDQLWKNQQHSSYEEARRKKKFRDEAKNRTRRKNLQHTQAGCLFRSKIEVRIGKDRSNSNQTKFRICPAEERQAAGISLSPRSLFNIDRPGRLVALACPL
ncbi:hypothetical protein PHSY_006623 [Pseudozyma hubeiensis SY62]|uniref:Uncharacterized protein n=1 Tax=Pseudozyma hubeiensis (strain SY62) TaxID=1305764 RepID=R9PCC7_PSEHS|nr:hypothetical protein PHSY_006623 [Pseudozyma hubeiensis SY62]GAC99026.1 hypothetical protein PHSY_006623 [Pseudozyma hubeiensis SY62]